MKALALAAAVLASWCATFSDDHPSAYYPSPPKQVRSVDECAEAAAADESIDIFECMFGKPEEQR